MNLGSVDLNLLVVLDALLHLRSVTGAARRLNLSQSAVSHALRRLREALGDELLVRVPGGMAPTARSEALIEPLRQALALVGDVVTAPRPFEPATAQRSFRVAAADYAQFVLLPELLRRLALEAPGVDVWIVSAATDDTDRLLQSGEVDLMVGVPPRGSRLGGIRERRLFDERFVCVVRGQHPVIQGALSLEDYVRLPHAFVAPRGREGGVVDEVLRSRGLSRRVALAVPHFLVVPYAIASSDLIVTLAARIAVAFARSMPLQVLDPPLPIPNFAIHMSWHERWNGDAGHAWFRGLLAASAEAVR